MTQDDIAAEHRGPGRAVPGVLAALALVTVGALVARARGGSYAVSASSQAPSRFESKEVRGRQPETLRGAAQMQDLLVGTSVLTGAAGFADPLLEPKYAETVARQFNMVEPENAMKWMVLHPAPNRYDFKPADEVVAFAMEHGMKVRGHTLCWGLNNPGWLEEYRSAPPEVVAKLLREHIQTVVSHFRGKVFAWDVVNEAFDNSRMPFGNHLQDSIWYNQPGMGRTGVGYGYMEKAFRWAHESDPKALLFYNDNNLLTDGPKFEAVYEMLADFVKRGVPVHGVGLQVHVKTDGYPDQTQLERNLGRIAALGLQIHMTEVDVALPVNAEGQASAMDLHRQAETYQRLLRACVRESRCTAFQIWGFTDKYSWIPAYLPGYGAALPWDRLYQPKPALAAMRTVLTDEARDGKRDGRRDTTPVCGQRK